MALSKSLWLAGTKYVRSGLLQNHGVLFRRSPILIVTPHQCLPELRNIFYKSPGSTMDALRIWKLMEYVGMDYCKIVRMRRRMKRFSYPWLTYCIPAAMILAIGDFIAQYHLKPHAADRTFKKFLTDEWVIGETLLFALMGFFPVGFLLSKWNLFFYRKLKCHSRLSFLLTKLLLDLLILSPIILALMTLIYGGVYDKNLFYESSEEVKKTFKQKYWPALKQSMIFNLVTRPLALFGIFYLAPLHLRRLFKTVYEIIFAAYITASIREHVQGIPSSAQKLDTSGRSGRMLATETSNENESDKGIGGIKRTLGKGISRCSGDDSPESLPEKPLSRWARYKRWACRNRED